MPADLLHLTLAFLGEVPDALLPPVSDAVGEAAAGCAPFDLSFDRIGRFPERGRPAVMWLGVADGAPEVEAAGAAVREALRRRGLAFDDKPFRPHVTLARVRHGAGSPPPLARTLAEPLRCRADTVHVIESVLGPRGPRYIPVHAVAFGDGRTAG